MTRLAAPGPGSTASAAIQRLVLHPRHPPGADPIQLEPASPPALIGRSSRCRIPLRSAQPGRDDLAVSREHAVIEERGGRWIITDLSRHGTFLNGVRLPGQTPTPLASRDHLRIGSWSFDVQIGADDAPDSRATSLLTVDRAGDASRIRRIDSRELGSLALNRLRIFLDCAERAQKSESEQALDEIILRAALDGSGFTRSAIVRPLGAGEGISVVSSLPPGQAFPCSRSLVRTAMEGDLAVLSPEAPEYGASIDTHQIRHALCAPMKIDGAIDCLLYLDSRGMEAPPHPDAAAFCDGMARFAALARADLQRKRLQREQRVMQRDLEAAKVIQTHLLPSTTGALRGLRYAMRLLPGRHVAGDLFDVIPLPDGAVAFCIGDVAGAGIGPGLLMAVTLAHLRAGLSGANNLESSVNRLNQYLCEHTPGNLFTSLWIGVIDPMRQCCSAIDAGHGHWLVWRAGAAAGESALRERHLPLGIDRDVNYTSTTFPFVPGDRLILYSDGVVECRRQREGEIELFGRQRIEAALAGSASAASDIECIVQALRDFCEEEELSDDTTAASIEYAV